MTPDSFEAMRLISSYNIDDLRIINTPHRMIILDDQKDVDMLLGQELNTMSAKERERIYEEIHGVEKPFPETENLIKISLDLMDKELHIIRPKPAYELAESMSSEYCHNPKFRLMFLRAEGFKPKKAATRFVKFFDGKLRLFGKDTLTRSLQLNDLNEGDQVALGSGCFQWLPFRDRSGRAVFFDARNMVSKTWQAGLNLARSYFYMTMSALEDEETQRRGVVSVMYNMGDSSDAVDDQELLKECPAAMEYLPYKFVSCHMCFENPPLVNAYARMLLGVCGPNYRARVRLHTGSQTQIQHSLLTFGLPMDLFPVSTEGEVKKTNLEKWIAKRKRKESRPDRADNKIERIDMPGRYDVLIGKGKPFQRHVGNVRLRAMVETFVGEYSKAPHGEKAQLARKVLRLVKHDCGRFLQKGRDEWWTEVPDSGALDKISKLFSSMKAHYPSKKRSNSDRSKVHKRMAHEQEEAYHGAKRLRARGSYHCLVHFS